MNEFQITGSEISSKMIMERRVLSSATRVAEVVIRLSREDPLSIDEAIEALQDFDTVKLTRNHRDLPGQEIDPNAYFGVSSERFDAIHRHIADQAMTFFE